MNFFPASAEVTINLVGYSASDWGVCFDDSRCTSGCLFCLGTSCVSWSSWKQETTAQSIAKAKYVAVASSVNQAIWLRKTLKDLGHEQTEVTRIISDNKSAISSISWSN